MTQPESINQQIIKLIKRFYLLDSNAFDIVFVKYQNMINMNNLFNQINKRMNIKQIPCQFNHNAKIQEINKIYCDSCLICHHKFYKEAFQDIMSHHYIKHILIIYQDQIQKEEGLIFNQNEKYEISLKVIYIHQQQFLSFLSFEIADNFIIHKADIQEYTSIMNKMVADIDANDKFKYFSYLQTYFMIVGMNLSQTIKDLNELKTNQINILSFYANKTEFHSINILLRRDSTFSIINYIRLAINYIYRDIQRTKTNKDFIRKQKKCFRGCLVNQQQLKQLKNSINNIIINRHFMSTSINRHIAEEFSINCLIIIIVTDKCLDGYCLLDKDISNRYEQQEILFNINNKFKVISVEQNMSKVNQSWIINLQHITFM